ncbi:MAG: hypothetical protein WBM14_15385, partial [Terracidiphilus sp.]
SDMNTSSPLTAPSSTSRAYGSRSEDVYETACRELEVSTDIPERKQAGKRNWDGEQFEQAAVEANQSRVTGDYGKQLLRRQGEFAERSFAHCYETGRNAALHLARAGEHFEAAADPCRRVQHPGAAEDAGSGQAARAERHCGKACFAPFLSSSPAATDRMAR